MTASPVATATVARDRHALTGPSVHLDPRRFAVRSDLTDLRLADRVFSPHYAKACERAALSLSPVRAGPSSNALILSELLPGEPFELLEISEALAWGRCLVDGIVGYVDPAVLGEPVAATHRIVQQAAPLHEAPDRNAVKLASLPIGSRVASLGERGDYCLTAHGYVAKASVLPMDERLTGGVAAAALLLIGTPKRAGGRSGAGVDPYGLIFLAHDIAGVVAPRLPDLLADSPDVDDGAPLAGDVMLFEDLPAIHVGNDRIVHVEEAHVVCETLDEVTRRLGHPTRTVRLS